MSVFSLLLRTVKFMAVGILTTDISTDSFVSASPHVTRYL